MRSIFTDEMMKRHQVQVSRGACSAGGQGEAGWRTSLVDYACRPPLRVAMQQSDDDDDEDYVNDEAESGERELRLQGGSSKRATAHRKGSKRVAAYEPPLPLEYQETDGGFQKYKLPDDICVWDRRSFIYTEEYKVGDVETTRPAQPPFFKDRYLFMRAKSKLPGKEDSAAKETKADVLKRRVERRIVKISCNFFLGWSFSHHYATPAELEVRLTEVVNPNLKAVFGDNASQWTAKQVWAWAFPEIELVGNAHTAFQTGALALLQSSTHSLLSLYTLGKPELFQKLTGAPNRLEMLDGNLRQAAELLQTVVLEGVLVPTGSGTKWKQRANLKELLFTAHEGKRGKASATDAAVQYEVGDTVDITIFSPSRTGSTQMFKAPSGPLVKVDEYGIFCDNLGEAALGRAIEELEKAVSKKRKIYPAAGKAKAARSGTGKERHYAVGHLAVAKLQDLLPRLDVDALKQMTYDLTSATEKDELISAFISVVVPGYPQTKAQELEAEHVTGD